MFTIFLYMLVREVKELCLPDMFESQDWEEVVKESNLEIIDNLKKKCTRNASSSKVTRISLGTGAWKHPLPLKLSTEHQ